MTYNLTSSGGYQHQITITPAQPGEAGAYTLAQLRENGWPCQACGQVLALNSIISDYAQQNQVEGSASGSTSVSLKVDLPDGHRPPHPPIG